MDNQERVIDLRVVCWQMLRKWVWIILGAVIGALLMGGFGAIKAGRQQNPVSEKQAMKALRDSMTPQAISEVDKLKAISDKIDKSNRYIADSPFMQVDPYNENVTYLDFLISENEKNELIKNMYEKYVEDGALSNDIIEEHKDLKSVKYARQMISFVDDSSNSGSNSQGSQRGEYVISDKDGKDVYHIKNTSASLFSVQVMGTTAKNSEKLAESVLKQIQEYKKVVCKKYENHTLELISQNTTVIIDDNTATSQTNLETQLANLQQQYSNSKDKLEDDQTTLLNYELSNTDGLAASEEVQVTPVSRINKKYIAVGFVMGAFVVVMCLGVWVILTDKIVSERQIADLGLVKVFGTYGKAKGTKLETKVLGDVGNDPEKQLESISVNVKLYCDKEEIDTLYLVGNKWQDSVKEQAKKLADRIGKLGLTCKVIENVSDDPSQLEKLGNGKNVLLLTDAGMESVSNVEKAIIQLERLGNTITGAVLLQ